jgi:hypothetical protein
VSRSSSLCATQAHRRRFNKLRSDNHRRGYLEFLEKYEGEDTGANILRFGWGRLSEAEKGVYITQATTAQALAAPAPQGQAPQIQITVTAGQGQTAQGQAPVQAPQSQTAPAVGSESGANDGADSQPQDALAQNTNFDNGGNFDDDQNPGSVPKNNAVDSTATSPGKRTGEGGQQITTVHRIDRSENGTPTAPEVQDPDVPQNDEASIYIYETSVIETGLAQKGLTQALADRFDEISTHLWR